ncbi:SDR family oxidoreductase [Nitrosomonas eutropha]|uniref:Nucleoside-diphosphate-sugar epimerase n=2 Tax=Nitrosomonas eutropha TaxID=916 RepID=A0ABX5M9X2_9PROT|nr:SDR family oxidoreductase [Nitrosomonas eutropha]ABI59298.1 NAD-dependent epimerase/dehydratase [Nitrosomonas eutropha C91]PXV81085.1 nucleoside-diphosphate-sugar epimerase [Nitrosomonas eutropha]SDW85176.1 Nucleoside-diphosphate-sugar epimerase [Nitrosomonas eutropha]SEI96701.1 Nucleoside-diphosphate-sugar epimerase [Nitrosomonas eutropha]
MKNKLLIVGCGDIASRVANLLGQCYQLFGLCRRVENFDHLRTLGITPIAGDLDQPASLERMAGVAAHSVLHLAPPPGQGKRDTRTLHLLSALSRRQSNTKKRILPQQLIYISTSGVYGDCSGNRVNESYPVNPRNDRAYRRLDAERQIRNWGMRNGVRVSILRVPGIYAHNRLPLERLRQGTPALLPAEDSYTNHIHADDLARIIVAALRFGKSGRIYHASDDSCLKMGEYFDLVANHFNFPGTRKITRQEAKETLSPSLLSFMLESRRLTNDRIKRELQVRLRYPTVGACLAEIEKIPVK